MAAIKNRYESPAARKLEYVQMMIDSIARRSSLRITVLGSQGLPLCKRESPDCSACGRNCRKTQERLFAVSRQTGAPVIDICGDSKLTTVALPIHVQDRLVATWIFCRPVVSEQGIAYNQGDVNVGRLTDLQQLIACLSWPIIELEQANQELKRKNLAIHKLAYTDPLLGIANRNQLNKDLEANKSGHLLLINVTDLAKVNTVYGRGTGNELLCALRDYLLCLEIPHSKLYRLVAANFGLLIRDASRDDLLQLAGKILRNCTHTWALQHENYRADVVFSTAVGILPLADLNDTEPESISAAVSYIMGQAVQSNGVAFFDGAVNNSYYRRLCLEMELRRAVHCGMQEFSVVYQPIVEADSALWKGVEALCRWENGKYGQVSPEEFIPIAEATGLIGELGLWVLDEAIRQIQVLGLSAADRFVLNVNLSPVQLADSHLADKILAIIRKHGYPPEKLCLEITESSDTFFDRIVTSLGKLIEEGVRFALDDFGVGYASLSSLYKLPVEIIKMDRSLVQNVEEIDFLQSLFAGMSELAHANGMKIVAEGVEMEEQARTLLFKGADYFQGYLFSTPLRFDELSERCGKFTQSQGSVGL